MLGRVRRLAHLPAPGAVAVCAAAFTMACATGVAPEAAAPRALDPAGVYDFSTTFDGAPLTGTIRIARREDGSHGGMITVPITDSMPIERVAVDGNRIEITAFGPDGTVTIVLEVHAADITGTWQYAGLSGTLSGRRRE